jgi:hypothetical protein
LRKLFRVIERVIDPHRFPWIKDGKPPTKQQRESALLASSVLLAAQRIATERRTSSKNQQESEVKKYLEDLGFAEAGAKQIDAYDEGPQKMQFCGECLLAERRADVFIRLHDKRLLALECKVSNSRVNSLKRINNDTIAKIEGWRATFGKFVIPAALLSGVFNIKNLEQAQKKGLSLFWSHDLNRLGAFIESTRL